MEWSQPERIGEAGYETLYGGTGFRARLIFDCHQEARKLEVVFPPRDAIPARLIEHLKPFGKPAVITPDQLVIFDRVGYFRLYVVPSRLQALLRKSAPLSVLAELLSQIERAEQHATCAECPSLCKVDALTYADGDASAGVGTGLLLRIDDARCTRCLDCVHHHLRERHLPPASPGLRSDD